MKELNLQFGVRVLGLWFRLRAIVRNLAKFRCVILVLTDFKRGLFRKILKGATLVAQYPYSNKGTLLWVSYFIRDP